MLRRRKSGVDLDAVHTALAEVEDPEIHQPITDLGMVGDVTATGEGVRIEVRLTTAACPLKEELRRGVTDAASTVSGVNKVDVTFAAMSEPERMAVARHLRRQQPAGTNPFAELDTKTQVYAVASGKGGVGKSAVTANLAVALAQQGHRVGVLDADVWGYSITQLFGARRAPVALNGMMLPVEAHGVRLMSMGFLVNDEKPVIWRGPMLHKALEQFLTDVYWGELDVLLVDLPPGTGDVTLSLLELCPSTQMLAVTTPQLAAQTVAARVGRMARDNNVPLSGVVENMAEFVCGGCGAHTPLFGQDGGRQLADILDAPLLGRIPLDLPLREASDAGQPAMVRTPEAASATELRRIAAGLPSMRRSLAGVSLPLTPV